MDQFLQEGLVLKLNIQDSIELASLGLFEFGVGRITCVEGRLDRFDFFLMNFPFPFSFKIS